MDRGALLATVHGVARADTKKKRKEKKILFFRIYEEQLSMITFLKILWYYFMGITMIYLINLLSLDI